MEHRIEDLGSLSSVSLSGEKEEWVSVVDIRNPVKDFHKRIPSMALTVRFISMYLTCTSWKIVLSIASIIISIQIFVMYISKSYFLCSLLAAFCSCLSKFVCVWLRKLVLCPLFLLSFGCFAVSIWTGYLPETGNHPFGESWQCLCCCSYFCWQDGCCRICNCHVATSHDTVQKETDLIFTI